MNPLTRNKMAVAVFAATVVAQVLVIGFVAKSWLPEFYSRRLAVSRDALAIGGAELEDRIEQFQLDTADDTSSWSLELTDEQINGWLAVELPRRFPRKLPRNIHEPRIAIDSGLCHVACQFRDGGTHVVLTMSFELQPSEKPNELKFRVVSAKIGSVPAFPTFESQAISKITQAAYRSRVRLQWLSRKGPIEAIARIPNQWLETDRQVHIEDIEFREGQLLVSGRSSERPPKAKKKRRSVASRNGNRIQ